MDCDFTLVPPYFPNYLLKILLFSDIFNIQLLLSFIICFISCCLAIWIILATTMKSRALYKNGAISVNLSTLIQPYKSQFQQSLRLWFLCLSVHGTCLLLCWVFVCFVLVLFFPSTYGLQSSSLNQSHHGHRNHLLVSWYLGS